VWSEVRLFRLRGAQAIIPTVLTLAVSGLALTLVAVVIARSPYTQGNLSLEDHDRTETVHVGDPKAIQVEPLAKAFTDPVRRGQSLFVRCAGCHGLKGQGATLAPAIAGADAAALAANTHKPGAGMPAFAGLSDEDLQSIAAYLKGSASPQGTSN